MSFCMKMTMVVERIWMNGPKAHLGCSNVPLVQRTCSIPHRYIRITIAASSHFFRQREKERDLPHFLSDSIHRIS
ncbi:hypothetical protein RIF29_07816 [Crotalaria pallida]|uniref:Uncharacterized protein n=1 Tax=Crotalaria pallida TaxID=3830 RepID=A0AAN9J5P6_CROPI